jgi:hypothetical protein
MKCRFSTQIVGNGLEVRSYKENAIMQVLVFYIS